MHGLSCPHGYNQHINQDHDSSYKFLFSNPELVRDLIMDFIPDEWLHSLDYSTLEKVPGHYVSDDFQQREDDIVWRVKVGSEWLYFYLLLEFQSRVDKYMALRMMVYIGLLYQDLIKRGDVLADGRLPPILPIVLYNGDSRWTAATEVAELIPAVPRLVEQFKLLRKQLERKLGPLPIKVTDKLNNATAIELERWGDAVLTANSLEAVFDHTLPH